MAILLLAWDCPKIKSEPEQNKAVLLLWDNTKESEKCPKLNYQKSIFMHSFAGGGLFSTKGEKHKEEFTGIFIR